MERFVGQPVFWNWVTKRTTDYDTTLLTFTAATATAAGFNSGFEHLTVDPDVTKRNLHGEVDTGSPVGREAW